MPELSVGLDRVAHHACTAQPVAGQKHHVASNVSRLAVLSLYKEVSLYPKPGLVSPVDSGSHQDMDYRMFLASINSLRHYFYLATLAGFENADFPRLKQLGLMAEADMLRATHGVNTHRGAIFNLGLLCAAAGFLSRQSCRYSPQALAQVVTRNWGVAIMASAEVTPAGQLSHGQQVALRCGALGARHEAASGFKAVLNHGLPAYQSGYALTQSREAAAVQALFSIMANLDDTNILWRAGLEGLGLVQNRAAEFLSEGGVSNVRWRERAINIHQEFVVRNLSPGGAADLLGVTLFMQIICQEF